MLFNAFNFNFSIILSLSYFINYAFIFLFFFFLIFDILNLNTNTYFIVTFLNYSKRFYLLFVLALLAFLGVPPFNIFSSKFAALTNS
jgi:formate hydrogenlyase subunit 3/multisubunit Na+/H+ antiporter MnhD subunit